MAPKKKGGSKGKVGSGNIIDGVNISQMTREQLETFCKRIKEETEREREERNFFQLERDKLQTFWEITKHQLHEAQSELRNKDRLIEEADEKNEAELMFCKQKVKHLQHEHQTELTEVKAEGLVSLKQSLDSHDYKERELLADKASLKQLMREQSLHYQDLIKSLKNKQAERISEIREDIGNRERNLGLTYERKCRDLEKELDTVYRMEVTELEERKNVQITELTKYYERAFSELKTYYDDITLNNLALISSLKDQMETLRVQNDQMLCQVQEVRRANKNLVEPLKQAQTEVLDQRDKLEKWQRDRMHLDKSRGRVASLQKELQDLRWAYDALSLTFEQLQNDKDTLSARFSDGILQIQQKMGQDNVVLRKQVQLLTEASEYKDAVIEELKSKVDDCDLVDTKFEDLLAKKNTVIGDLQYELARVCKAQKDLWRVCEERMRQGGVPEDTICKILPKL